MSVPEKRRKTLDVPADLIDSFEEIYPQHGAFTWFVSECLRHFNDIHTLKPTDEVRDAVNLTLGLSPK